MKKETNEEFIQRVTTRGNNAYDMGVRQGRYKPLEEVDLSDEGDPIHIKILTDGYLYRLLYLAYNKAPMSLQEIADLMGLSRERARQYEAKAFCKLKRNKHVREMAESKELL